jgi:NhaD family Na+/H+ antiporter
MTIAPAKDNLRKVLFITLTLTFFGWSGFTLASESGSSELLNLTTTSLGFFCVFIFVLAYLFVMAEEFTHLSKSKPVLIAAGIIWITVASIYISHDMPHVAENAIRHNILEYAELFLFLLVAMTYINSMDERLVFEALRSALVRSGFSFKKLFWLTGALAFFISPVADNLTTALLMCAVILSVGRGNAKFISLACINVVVGANAGGAFSPFGDITTLMVWQKGIVDFWEFFALFIPSFVNWFVPAFIMQFAIPDEAPLSSPEIIIMKRGAKRVILFFLLTIVTAVSFHNFLHLPPVAGMMMGLGFLGVLGYYLKKTFDPQKAYQRRKTNTDLTIGDIVPFDIYRNIARSEWDTLLFFYGVILCVGGLSLMGYLAILSEAMYVGLGPTIANILVGVLSAIVDNIPVMFAVLTMGPDMSHGQWLLVTLTAGVGGSLLSIGSAAGVALMGQARGQYTFFAHLKWAPVIAFGYAASILAHFWVNASKF